MEDTHNNKNLVTFSRSSEELITETNKEDLSQVTNSTFSQKPRTLTPSNTFPLLETSCIGNRTPSDKQRLPPKDLRHRALSLHKSMHSMWNSKKSCRKLKLSSFLTDEILPVALDYGYQLFKTLTGIHPSPLDLINLRTQIDTFLKDQNIVDQILFPTPTLVTNSSPTLSTSNSSSSSLITRSLPSTMDDLRSEPPTLLDLHRFNGLLEENLLPFIKKNHPQEISVPLKNKENTQIKRFDISSFSEQGNRTENEDDFLVIEDISVIKEFPPFTPKGNNNVGLLQAFLGVYDGHNGNQAAEYSRIHLHYNIINSPHFETNIELAIREGYSKTDQRFQHTASIHKFESGSTALGVFLLSDRVVITNVGDTCCVLGSPNGSATELSYKHLPDSEDENKRILSNGGVVVWYGCWRVNGFLGVTRSIGDRNLKSLVISDPFIRNCSYCQDQFLILATDGLWNVMSLEEAVNFVKEKEKKSERKSIAQLLCGEALERKTTDNVTVIIIWFDKK